MDLKVVGQPVARIEGPDKVTGQTAYAADVRLRGMLWGKCLRSPHGHARLLNVDASRARRVKGVHAVLTGADVPDVRVGLSLRDVPILAREKARFIGDRVAAVAAETAEACEEALSLIAVDYEELPAVSNIREALAKDAPVVHEQLAAYAGVPSRPEDQPNAFFLQEHTKGVVAQAFPEADVVLEHEFFTQQVHQAYIEPHAAVVSIEQDGGIHIWASCKAPFRLKKLLAEQLGLPQEKLHVHSVAVGGDFGGKGSLMDVPICYYLAKTSGRPVKMVMSYSEELMAGDPRHASVCRLKVGSKRDGTLVALDAEVYFDSGAYSGFKPSEITGTFITNAYSLPHYRIRTYNVYTNGVPGGYMKSPGQPQVVFAIESMMDILARKLGLEPLELRMRNLMQDGDVLPNKRRMEKLRCRETLQALVRTAAWNRPRSGPNTGRGVAFSFRHTGGSGMVNLEVGCSPEGRIRIVTAIPDIGTGTHTLLRQIAAELLTLSPEEVEVWPGDTDTFETDAEPGGSKITAMVGQALVEAVNELREKLIAAAADRLGCRPGEVRLEEGRFVCGENVASLSDLARDGASPNPSLSVRKSYKPERSAVPGFFAQVVEVHVDRETGSLRIQRVATAHDVGTIINPVTHQGQIDGGLVQGVGYASMEEMTRDGVRVTTLNLGDFRIPCMKDIPELETVLVHSAAGPGPFAAKSIGENSIVPTAAAVANAVEDAVGVRVFDLPVTAEKIYRALSVSQNDRRPPTADR